MNITSRGLQCVNIDALSVVLSLRDLEYRAWESEYR